MAEAWEPPGDGGSGGSFRPFDRQALEATLADALRDAEVADQQAAAGDPDASSAPATPPAATAAPAAPPAPAAAPGAPPVAAPPKLNPFGGRPAASGAPVPSGAAPSSGPAAPGPRTGPSILSGGVSGAISRMAPGGSGGGTISGLRPPGGGSLGGSLGAPRPLPGMGALGSTSQTIDEPVEAAATISLRRPTRAEPVPEPQAEAAPPPPAPTRSSVPVAAWMPGDDDILPRSQSKRKGRKR
ncbi:MAG TPA: hypothetical protein VFH58_08075 [Acidimicrobiales bacterium]|nr:hypothetical protein [Acidimicrobiales bacterium]